MRSVNANLLEINQAKSRINQAKKEGKNPDQKDLELVKTEKQNAFAISQYTDIMTIEKFAKHITSHGSVYSRADISAILYIAVDCMREMLLEGKKIRLGDLGDFSLLLTSKGAEDADKFTAQNITGVKVQWEPGQEFKNLRDDAEFNLVASRSAQAAVIKAIKEGKTSVDLNAPTTPDNTPGASTPGGSNTGQTGSEGQGSESGGGTTGKDDTGDGLEQPKDRLARVLAPSPAYPPPKNSTFNTQHSTFKKNESEHLENNSADSHQHTDRYRYYARSNELHGIKNMESTFYNKQTHP